MTTTKAYRGLPMEGVIASWYAKTTLKDINRHQRMAREMFEKIPVNGTVLEIAPGPGYFCVELARLGNFQITGLDISRSFVNIARGNAAEAGLQIDFQEGNAADMPFKDKTFDFTFCQAAFKNFSEPVQAIREMYRVLKPHGLAVIADMRSDVTSEEIELEIQGMELDRINTLLVRWTFNHMLIRTAYSLEAMRNMVAQTPFGKCRIEVSGVGFLAWLEK